MALRKRMRELWDAYPEAFADVMDCLMPSGGWQRWFPPMPKTRDGKVLKITHRMLGELLVSYRERPKVVTREVFVLTFEMIQAGPYAYTRWQGEHTVLYYLRQAERLYKLSPEFRALVAKLGVKTP